jgi:hypothetical protein
LAAYKEVPDKDFNSYIKSKEDRHNEGETLDPKKFMAQVLNHYLIKVEKKEWTAPTKAEESIVALEAQLKNLKGQLGQAKDFSSAKERAATRDRSTPAWKKKAPKPGEATTMTKQGKLYNWCKFHNLWCIHKEGDCKLNPNASNATNDAPAAPAPAPSAQTLRLQAALATIVEDEDNN